MLASKKTNQVPKASYFKQTKQNSGSKPEPQSKQKFEDIIEEVEVQLSKSGSSKGETKTSNKLYTPYQVISISTYKTFDVNIRKISYIILFAYKTQFCLLNHLLMINDIFFFIKYFSQHNVRSPIVLTRILILLKLGIKFTY